MSLVWHQFRYSRLIFWRNPASVFFTILLPLIFLVIFSSIFGNETLEERGGLKVSTYYVPGIVTLAIVSATLVSLAIGLTEAREGGLLKRLRATPAPPWALIGGAALNAVLTSFLMVVAVTVIGNVLYGVEIPTETLPALAATLVVSAISFCCLGFALTAVIPSEQAAPAITNVTVLPLYFLSGVFIPETEIPEGVLQVADLFPIRHAFEAFLSAYDPATLGTGFEPGHLLVVAGWGMAGFLCALRFFSWAPR